MTRKSVTIIAAISSILKDDIYAKFKPNE